MALLLPSFTLILARTGSAQIAVQPSLAVVEFHNNKTPGSSYGKAAAEAVTTEFNNLNQYDVEPPELVAKAIDTLKISSPPEGHVNLFRVAQELRLSYIVSGEISDYRIISDGAGRHAIVALSVIVYNVDSQTALNGAAITAESVSRPNNVDEATLVKDAIATGASLAVHQIHEHALPAATVLNTQIESALINQGSRTGFSEGQHVVVTRGHLQVATAVISDVEPDSATIHLERSYQGIQPGDKVHVVFEIPLSLGIDAAGVVHRPHAHHGVNANTSIISALLVVGLVVALLSNGNSNATDAASQVTAEAELRDNNSGPPAVRVSWDPSWAFKGVGDQYQWQVFRSDIGGGPVIVVSGGATQTDDNVTPQQNPPGAGTAPVTGNSNQNCQTSITAATQYPTGISPGRPYTYQVELLYDFSESLIPGFTGSTTGGTTAGTTTTGTTAGTTTTGTTTTGTTTTGTTTTGTTTTGTTTTGTTTTGTTSTTTGTTTTGTVNGAVCYFLSTLSRPSGIATPVPPPELTTQAGAFDSQPYVFSSVYKAITDASGNYPNYAGVYQQTYQYILQFSTTYNFTPATTYNAGIKQSVLQATSFNIYANIWPVAGESSSAPSFIQNSSSVYWRVGVRNVADSPGPIQTGSSLRYIFSQPSVVTKPGTPPGAPIKRQKKA
jgi:hypothetical protein